MYAEAYFVSHIDNYPDFRLFKTGTVTSLLIFPQRLSLLTRSGSGKGQTIVKANYSFLNSSKKPTELTILSKVDVQNSEFHLVFGRIENTINCFRDLLTFEHLILEVFAILEIMNTVSS